MQLKETTTIKHSGDDILAVYYEGAKVWPPAPAVAQLNAGEWDSSGVNIVKNPDGTVTLTAVKGGVVRMVPAVFPSMVQGNKYRFELTITAITGDATVGFINYYNAYPEQESGGYSNINAPGTFNSFVDFSPYNDYYGEMTNKPDTGPGIYLDNGNSVTVSNRVFEKIS